ncbi:hypothetical protein PMAYCL1PPCAC_31231, partial [Pristionchus mayeri]
TSSTDYEKTVSTASMPTTTATSTASTSSSDGTTTTTPTPFPNWFGEVEKGPTLICNATLCLCPNGKELRVNCMSKIITAYGLFPKDGLRMVRGEDVENVYAMVEEKILSVKCMSSHRAVFAPTCPLAIVFSGGYTERAACETEIYKTTNYRGKKCTDSSPMQAATCGSEGYLCGKVSWRIGSVYC